ncbi:DUF934 domain-containing protein [uncultured Roseibium sp.]|uniref:DUF934 domain-containing protein n=1 Tax=uncultured Roseibium sp. TaxID=1936171 RepID=UPI0032168404
MTTIYANGAFIEESWNVIDGEDDLPVDGNVTVPLDRFLEAPETLLRRGGKIAVLIAAGEKAEALRPHLDRIPLVIVAFPKFTDGRGFSAARILREELGYRGDIRAAGDYILDQVPLMRRCGISSFEISKPEVVKALKQGEWPEVTRYLQPVGTVEEIPAGTRPWARRSLRETAQAAE